MMMTTKVVVEVTVDFGEEERRTVLGVNTIVWTNKPVDDFVEVDGEK